MPCYYRELQPGSSGYQAKEFKMTSASERVPFVKFDLFCLPFKLLHSNCRPHSRRSHLSRPTICLPYRSSPHFMARISGDHEVAKP
uniref:Uncharacterized protein n=1 Tax=Steinernema glaseri TaxID=37863 RepID=A0A1I7ZZU1_9BILA